MSIGMNHIMPFTTRILSRRKTIVGWCWLVVVMFVQVTMMTPLSEAMPSMLLDSGRPKCVTVAAPKDTRLEIKYEAPDWEAQDNHNNKGEGHDVSASKKTLMLTITSRAPHNLMDFASSATGFVNSLKDARHDISKLKHRFSQHHASSSLTEEITASSGSFPYELKEDGVVIVCVRAPGAVAKRPMRFGLSIRKDTISVMQEEERRLQERQQKEEQQAAADYHLTRMEAEMARLVTTMKDILANADFAKERDTLLHQQTIAMHSASRFWPIVQVCVLVMTSFTQVTHIVRFFKSRRII